MAGKKGRSGRKPGPFKQFMRSVADDPEAWQTALEKAREDPFFWLKCCEFAHGRPPQALAVQHGPLQVNVSFGDPIEGVPLEEDD